MACFAFLSRKGSDSKGRARLNKAAAAVEQSSAAHIPSNFNDKRLVFNLFSSAENGRLSKDELKAYLKKSNSDKSDDSVKKKVDEVILVLEAPNSENAF